MFWIPLMIAASTALSAGSMLMSGQMNKAANKASAAAAKQEAANARLRAVQVGELSRQRLAQTLSAQETVFANRGVSSNSATSMALERKTIDNAYRDEAINVLSELNRASASDSAASGYSMAAKYAMPLATLQAGATALDGGAKSYKTYKGG